MRNRASFESEAVPHLESLLRTAIRMSGDRARAEDAVQETYLRAWRSFRTYQPETNCRAWLFRILVNVIKKAAGKRRHDPLAEAEEVETSAKVIPLFPNTDGGERRDIQGALNHLAPEFRDVLWLVIVEGFAYKETAQMLDIPIGTVMSRLYRARRELRRFRQHSPLKRKKGLRVMECKEFQKLLSPFVDNELGASETFLVAEHLEICAPCRREMETLRRFDEQLKTAGQTPLEGVEDFRLRILGLISPWAWARRWRGLGAAAAVLMFLFIGPQLFSAPSDPEMDAFSESLISEVRLNINQPFSLPWLDPQSLQNVLQKEGLDEIPSLAPAGFHFEGGRVCNPLSRPFIQLVYRNRDEEISLFVSRRWDRPFSGVVKRDGFTIVPLGIRAVFLVTKDSLPNFVDTRQVAEEEINAVSS